MKEIGTFKTDQSGFTLVEILVSLVIILILVMAFVPMFELVAKTVSSNKAKETATALANTTLEEIRSLPFIVLNSTTGEVETDPHIPQLGTYNGDLTNYTPGNPPGSVPAIKDQQINNITFTIKTSISWDATLSYKKITVIVEAPSAFKGSVKTTSKFYTLAAEEGELFLPKSGFILVHIKDKDGNLLTSPETLVKIEAQTGTALTQENYTESGEKLFGMLRADTYTVSAKVPADMAYSPDQVIIVDEWLIETNIDVNDGNTSEVTFYIDYPGKISLELKDDTTNQAIIGNGIIELSWDNGSTLFNLPPISFKPDDFDSSKLRPSAIGNLWPGGNYSIKLTDLLDSTTLHAFKEYDMATAGTKPKKNDGFDWDGSFEIANSTLSLTIKFYSPPNTLKNSLLKTHLVATDGTVERDTIEDPNNPGEYIEVVSIWKDQSGNDYNATPLDTNRPLFISNVINNQPVIRFSGLDQQKLSIDGNAKCFNNFTIFVVAKTEEEHEIDAQSTTGAGGLEGQKYLFWPDWGGYINAGQGLSLGINGVSIYEHADGYMPATAVYKGTLTEFNLITIKYEDKYPFIYVNGDTDHLTEGSESPRTAVFSPVIIGGNVYGYFTGDIAEILIYDSPLNDANIVLVNSVLKAKYGLP